MQDDAYEGCLIDREGCRSGDEGGCYEDEACSCIDKGSSAELTEAINSMYRWYQRSQRCYVYFSDLEAGADLGTQLSKCRW